ncbi:MAG: hypothetical protein ACK47M_02975, partial [Caldilinea sp.]
MTAYEFGAGPASAMGFGNEWVLEFGPNIKKYLNGNLHDRWSDGWNNEVGRQIGAYVRERNLPVEAIDFLVRYALESGVLTGLIRDPATDRVVGFTQIPAADGSTPQISTAMLDAAIASSDYTTFAAAPTVFASDFHELVTTPEGQLVLDELERRLDEALRRALGGIDLNPLPNWNPLQLPPNYSFLRPFSLASRPKAGPLVGISTDPLVIRKSARSFTLIESFDYGGGRTETVTKEFVSSVDLPNDIDPYNIPSGAQVISIAEVRNFGGAEVSSFAQVSRGEVSAATATYTSNGETASYTMYRDAARALSPYGGFTVDNSFSWLGENALLVTTDGISRLYRGANSVLRELIDGIAEVVEETIGALSEISFGQIGSIFGSNLARLIDTDDAWEALGVGTLLSTIGLNVGQGIDNALDDDALTLFRDAFDDLPQDFASSGLGAVSSYLFSEWINEQGLSEFDAGLVNAGAGAAIGAIAENLVHLGQEFTTTIGGEVFYTNFNNQLINSSGQAIEQFGGSPVLKVENVAPPPGATRTWNTGLGSSALYLNAVGSFLGSYLASKLIEFDTIGGQIGASIGSAIGSTVALASMKEGAFLGFKFFGFAGPIAA